MWKNVQHFGYKSSFVTQQETSTFHELFICMPFDIFCNQDNEQFMYRSVKLLKKLAPDNLVVLELTFTIGHLHLPQENDINCLTGARTLAWTTEVIQTYNLWTLIDK